MDGQFIRAALVAGVHGLRRTKDVRDLLLRQVVILTQIAHALDICHVHIFTPTDVLMKILYQIKMFTIDISKYLYYNK